MKKWLVAYVRLHHEKKTAERLTAMNIENFLPPLKGLEGELVEMDGKAKVVVRLDLLGCAGVDMPVGFVEKIK